MLVSNCSLIFPGKIPDVSQGTKALSRDLRLAPAGIFASPGRQSVEEAAGEALMRKKQLETVEGILQVSWRGGFNGKKRFKHRIMMSQMGFFIGIEPSNI